MRTDDDGKILTIDDRYSIKLLRSIMGIENDNEGAAVCKIAWLQ